MIIRKFVSCIFAILGTALLVFSIGLCLVSLDAPVRMEDVPDGAQRCAEAFCDAVNQGDLAAAGALIYGQPDLGVEVQPATEQGALVWNAYADSMVCEFSGNFYAAQSGLARDARITALDIAALMEKLSQYAESSLSAKINAAETLTEIYDENNNYRADLVEQVMREALQQALNWEKATVSIDVTFRMIYRDGSWWIMPDQALLQALSGQ